MKKAKNIVIANWKMNPASSKEAQSLYRKIRKVAVKLQNVTTIICPPFLYLSGLLKLSGGHRVLLGAQDVFFEEIVVSADLGDGSNAEYDPKKVRLFVWEKR